MGGGEDDYTLIFSELLVSFFQTAYFPKELLETFFFLHLKNGYFNPSTLVTTSYQIQIKDINYMIKNYLEKLVLMLQKLLFHK